VGVEHPLGVDGAAPLLLDADDLGAATLQSVASMPADPVAETGKVRAFSVR
jgi:hypothetical protein